jgi:hypothetical protein
MNYWSLNEWCFIGISMMIKILDDRRFFEKHIIVSIEIVLDRIDKENYYE